MLKIKDNVDLKELEKFGFIEVIEKLNGREYENMWGDFDYTFEDCYAQYTAIGRRGQQYYILVSKITRVVYIYATKPDGDGTKGELDNTLYDLIKADLVEKVD